MICALLSLPLLGFFHFARFAFRSVFPFSFFPSFVIRNNPSRSFFSQPLDEFILFEVAFSLLRATIVDFSLRHFPPHVSRCVIIHLNRTRVRASVAANFPSNVIKESRNVVNVELRLRSDGLGPQLTPRRSMWSATIRPCNEPEGAWGGRKFSGIGNFCRSVHST